MSQNQTTLPDTEGARRRYNKELGILALSLFICSAVAMAFAFTMMSGANATELQQRTAPILWLFTASLISAYAGIYFTGRSFRLSRSTSAVIMLALFGVLTLIASYHGVEPLTNLMLGQAQPVDFKL